MLFQEFYRHRRIPHFRCPGPRWRPPEWFLTGAHIRPPGCDINRHAFILVSEILLGLFTIGAISAFGTLFSGILLVADLEHIYFPMTLRLFPFDALTSLLFLLPPNVKMLGLSTSFLSIGIFASRVLGQTELPGGYAPFINATANASTTPVGLNILTKTGLRNDTAPNLYGWMFEDINHSGDGGIYGELLVNRAFEGSNVNWGTMPGYSYNSITYQENSCEAYGMQEIP